MWVEIKNKTNFDWDDRNSSQGFVPGLAWGSLTTAQRNGERRAESELQDHPAAGRGSGIIPGGLAAAVFISFLLVLYAILWKCMVTSPKRGQKKRRWKSGEQKQKQLVC
ncbi:hypothetical protein JZ751_004609 [Albula glossodonta]|uniref:Uncharacterized protein n=1 Tax=Albula glossodonta TaxID=121402 RepID=A0A8T2N7U7_9TELE|nr:hypothetical protein JZ751_004609 [Albula glossodonta]